MKKATLIILYFILFPLDAYSITLKSALKLTYENNLELQAERKNLEVQKEVLNIFFLTAKSKSSLKRSKYKKVDIKVF